MNVSNPNISNPNERLIILESEYNLNRDRIAMLNHTLIESHKKLSQEIRSLHNELTLLKSELSEVKLAANHIIQEMSQFAKKDQVKVLEKYINLWSPLNFVTQNELNQLLKERKERGVQYRTHSKTKASSKSR